MTDPFRRVGRIALVLSSPNVKVLSGLPPWLDPHSGEISAAAETVHRAAHERNDVIDRGTAEAESPWTVERTNHRLPCFWMLTMCYFLNFY
ncbi:MAG: hypothetical protein ACRDRS_22600 [Pseudonocardiaceae bacterium]